MKVVTIVGARPQFIKAAPLSRALRLHHTEILVHTGQHYDDNMSAVFFNELEISLPDYNLGIGSALHGAQTGAMLSGIEPVLLREHPDWVLIYGDTNSSLAGALAAAKLHIRVAHVEAGLRSFNRRMPEEVNRVVADHLSDLLLCPSQTAVDNLANEGILVGVHLVGDVMADALAYAVERASTRSNILERLGLTERGYLLATVHRPENTDNVLHLQDILAAFGEIREPIVFPIHPRTRKALESAGLGTPSGDLRLIDPVGYLDMVQLESSARMILTDSGGMQKEAYWLGVPCVTLREETEWVETVQTGWNQVVGADRQRIVQAVQSSSRPADHPQLYVDGSAAVQCVTCLESASVSR
jgi:UDP-N-acetylglucosamine 2-epimerase